MDRIFWIGIGIGAVLSLLASVVANLAHSRITALLDSRKLISHEKRKQRALEEFQVITNLHSGKRDRYFLLIRLASGVGMAGVLTWVSISSAILLLALSTPPTVPLSDNIDPQLYLRIAFILFFLFSSFVGLYLLRHAARRYFTVTAALNDYDRYCVEFKERWGS